MKYATTIRHYDGDRLVCWLNVKKTADELERLKRMGYVLTACGSRVIADLEVNKQLTCKGIDK